MAWKGSAMMGNPIPIIKFFYYINPEYKTLDTTPANNTKVGVIKKDFWVDNL